MCQPRWNRDLNFIVSTLHLHLALSVVDKLTRRLPVFCRPHVISGTTVATKADVDKREDGMLNTNDAIEYRLRVSR